MRSAAMSDYDILMPNDPMRSEIQLEHDRVTLLDMISSDPEHPKVVILDTLGTPPKPPFLDPFWMVLL